MEQGTGKTLPILYHIAKLFEDGEIESALVVAPLSTLGAWTRDIDLLHPKQQTALKSLVTVNYDKVWRRDEFIKGKWDLIVLDESHAIKHRTSKRSKALRKMANSATYRYILTGTPMSNGHLHEYWAQYDFLNPEVFGRYGQFQDRYCILNQFNQPYKYKRVDELTEIINRHCYRITKEECLDLPDKLPDDVVKIELKEKKKYKQMMDNIIKELGVEASTPLVRLGKLRQIASGFVVDEYGENHELKTDKLTVLEELIESRGDKKTVVFAHYKHSIDKISGMLTTKKIKHVILDGRQQNKNIWRDFQSDPSISVIVCQYGSANAGIDLFASDAMIMYEPTLSSTINDQAKDRIHRIGQSSKCSYYYLITKGTVEVQIYNTIVKGGDFNKEILLDYIRTNQK